MSPSRPLEHIRVFDLTHVWSGPYAAQMLAAMGAEVIHFESTRRPDMARQTLVLPIDRGHPVDRSLYFAQHNRGKLGVSLNLSDERGRDLFLRMLPRADAVINNYSNRVMENWGLTFERLSAVNPGVVVVALPSYGGTGPNRDHVAYGDALEAATGLMRPRGYSAGEPIRDGVPYPDATAGLAAAGAILLGLASRRRTGRGVAVDISQRDVSLRNMGEAFVAFQLNGDEPEQWRNSHPHWCPHGTYPAAGDDRWLAIAVRTDDEWVSLCRVMRREELASDPRFESSFQRLRHRHEADALVSDWSRHVDNHEGQRLLMAAGIPAGAVLYPEDLLTDDQLAARRFYPEVEHPVTGRHRLFSMPQVFRRVETRTAARAPLFGEHTREVLRRLAGVDDQEYERLEAAGVVGGVPDYSAGITW